MEKEFQHTDSKNTLVNETNEIYQSKSQQDAHQLEEALQRTDMERFQFLMQLIKTNRMMQKMSITHHD